jgi:tetratricopeptide (TPR) repeat protein
VIAALLAAAVGVAVPADAAYRHALERFYDGSTDGALQTMARLAEENPEDPIAPYVEALALCWKVEQRPDSRALDRDFHRRVDRAIALATTRLEKDEADVRARLARGAAHGIRSRFHLFRGDKGDSARSAVAMREDLLEARVLAPDSKDVAFGLGLYDYYADVLPRIAKLLRFFARIPGGDRERGLALIESAREGSILHDTEVQVQLYEIYAYYEEKPDAALAEIRGLHERYPGSPLWALQLVEHLRDRLGLYADAASTAREILAAAEASRPNFAPVVGAMARVALGEALLLDLRLPEARAALLPVKDGVPDAPWIAARARLLLGKSLELEGDGEAAQVHYRAAASSSERELKRRAQSALSSPIGAGEVRAAQLLAEARRLRESGRVSDAAETYRRAREASPDSDEARMRVAEDELHDGEVDRARDILDDLEDEKEPSPPWVRPWTLLLVAHLHDLQGRRASAVAEYKRVLKEPYGQDELRAQAAAGLKQPFRTRERRRGTGATADHQN